MSEPRTEAGRALLALLGWFASEKGNALREGILAIEAEATVGHAECEANMDAEIERLTLALASEPRELDEARRRDEQYALDYREGYLAAQARLASDWSPLLDIAHDEDGSWSVGIRAMSGHVGAAETLQEAIVEAADAAEAWVAASKTPPREDIEAIVDSIVERYSDALSALGSESPPGVEERAWRNLDTAHEDIAAMLRASGLGDYARPISTHDVIQRELLPWIERQAASEPRETALREAAQAYLDAEAEPAYSWVIENQAARAEGRPNREVERMNRIIAARTVLLAALADTPASEGSTR